MPRKNLRVLAGRPLLEYVVEQALVAREVTRVVVSTDDAEITAVARQLGAEVLLRPAEISGDTASSEAAVLHALGFLELSEGWTSELTVMLQCTSPLTLSEDIDGTIRELRDQQADSAFTATPFFHFLWSGDSHGADGINHDKRIRSRRQDLHPQFLETGAVYAMRTAGFLEARHRFFGRTAMHVVPSARHLEIDEPVDFLKAEALLRERNRDAAAELLPRKIDAVVFDFDGVFTDNRVLVTETGEEAVLCNRGDGLGLNRLRKLGVPMLVISTERNPVVAARCRKLGIECVQRIDDKLPVLRRIAGDRGFDLRQVVYVGNDVNDVECLLASGCGVCPADAHPEAKSASRLVLGSNGGRGAIRELCDILVTRHAHRDAVTLEQCSFAPVSLP